jgi:hypothetical protein
VSARARKLRRAALRLLVVLGAVYLLAATAAFLGQRWLIYPRWLREARPAAGQGVEGLERLSLELAEGGAVEAWFLPGRGVSAARPGPLLVFAHGNAELIEDWPGRLEPYRELGLSVLLPEYRGYGRSGGRPSQAALVEDAVRFVDLARARPEVDPERVVYHGRSLGGGLVCQLALLRPPRALVLQSTFARLSDLAWSSGLPSFLVLDDWDNQAALGRLEAPVLLWHGTRDELVPFAHARRNLAASRRARLVDEPCGHNDCPVDPVRYWRELEAFLVEAGVLPGRV